MIRLPKLYVANFSFLYFKSLEFQTAINKNLILVGCRKYLFWLFYFKHQGTSSYILFYTHRSSKHKPISILRLGTKGMCTLWNSVKIHGLGKFVFYTQQFYTTKFYFRWMKNLLHTILGIFLTEIIYLPNGLYWLSKISLFHRWMSVC